MSDLDAWIYFEGRTPESVTPLLAAISGPPGPFVSDEEIDRAADEFFGTFDERVARSSAEPTADPPGPEPLPVAPPPPLPAVVPAEEAPFLHFATWADLSVRFLGEGAADKPAALAALRLDEEGWRRIDDWYLRLLSDDLRAGRTERPSFYQARCHAELGRRAGTPPPPATPPPVTRAPPGRAPDALRTTAESLDLPAAVHAAMGRLPFRPPAEATPPPEKAAARTLKVPVMASLGGTLPLDSTAIQRAVAAVPFMGQAPGTTTVVSFPALTVRQYVSLRGELWARPGARAETLLRYGVPNEAALAALEQHWREQITANAELRAAVDEAAALYTRWVRGESR